jgi:hypothetical protein
MERQISRAYAENPFVSSALELIEQHRGQNLDIRKLSALLGEREPRLSPRNLDCAAQEAMRRSGDGWISKAEETRRIEEARKTAEAEAMRQAEKAGKVVGETDMADFEIHPDAADEEAA